jgi:hypothetical protein
MIAMIVIVRSNARTASISSIRGPAGSGAIPLRQSTAIRNTEDDLVSTPLIGADTSCLMDGRLKLLRLRVLSMLKGF